MPGADPLKASLTLVVLSVTGNQDENNMTDANPSPRIALFVPPSIREVFLDALASLDFTLVSERAIVSI